jgi:hypothetical protein
LSSPFLKNLRRTARRDLPGSWRKSALAENLAVFCRFEAKTVRSDRDWIDAGEQEPPADGSGNFHLGMKLAPSERGCTARSISIRYRIRLARRVQPRSGTGFVLLGAFNFDPVPDSSCSARSTSIRYRIRFARPVQPRSGTGSVLLGAFNFDPVPDSSCTARLTSIRYRIRLARRVQLRSGTGSVLLGPFNLDPVPNSSCSARSTPIRYRIRLARRVQLRSGTGSVLFPLGDLDPLPEDPSPQPSPRLSRRVTFHQRGRGEGAGWQERQEDPAVDHTHKTPAVFSLCEATRRRLRQACEQVLAAYRCAAESPQSQRVLRDRAVVRCECHEVRG